MNPLLSINIPTYNRAHYLDALLRSLLEDFKALGGRVEINVIDNASTDGTHEVVGRLKDFENITYTRHDRNLGAMANIHFAHRAGNGRYVWVLGDDDYVQPGQLRRIFGALENNPAIVLLSYSRKTPDGRLVGQVAIGEQDRRFDIKSPDFCFQHVDSLVGFLSANIIERHFIELFSAAEYEALDAQGELAHSMIYYHAISEGGVVHYAAGFPLVQTVDNGYLRHKDWMHVCVRYCTKLPELLSGLSFRQHKCAKFFRSRLLRECVRRILSEKYRGNSFYPIVSETIIRNALGWRFGALLFVGLLPSPWVRGIYDLFYTSRK